MVMARIMLRTIAGILWVAKIDALLDRISCKTRNTPVEYGTCWMMIMRLNRNLAFKWMPRDTPMLGNWLACSFLGWGRTRSQLCFRWLGCEIEGYLIDRLELALRAS